MACRRGNFDEGGVTDEEFILARTTSRIGAWRENDFSLMGRPILRSGLRHSIGIAVRVAICAASSVAVTTITRSDEIMTYHNRTADR
jgi:hypothetical protein